MILLDEAPLDGLEKLNTSEVSPESKNDLRPLLCNILLEPCSCNLKDFSLKFSVYSLEVCLIRKPMNLFFSEASCLEPESEIYFA